MSTMSGEPELENISAPESECWAADADGQSQDIGSLAIGMMNLRQAEIPQAIEQLDDIVRGTEAAANQIMDVCTVLEAVIANLSGEPAERVGDALTKIYEACGFQDLAGQRITHVTKTLGLIEGKLSELTSRFAILASDFGEGSEESGTVTADHLINVHLDGPQHPEDATDQASVDRLFHAS